MATKTKNNPEAFSFKKNIYLCRCYIFLAMEYTFNNDLVQIKDLNLNSYTKNVNYDLSGNIDGFYIIIPDNQPQTVVDCEIGYYNTKEKQRYPFMIDIDCVSIFKISAVITKYKPDFGSYLSYGLYKQYHYKIELRINSLSQRERGWGESKNEKETIVYSSKDYINLDENHSSKDYAYTISNLIDVHIPNLRFALSHRISVYDIDFKKYLSEHKETLEARILSIFSDLDLTIINNHAYIQINCSSADTWIMYIVSKIIGCIPLVDYKNEFYLFEIQDAKEYNQYKKNIIVGLLTNYNINDDILFSFIRKDRLKSYTKDKGREYYVECSEDFKEKYSGVLDFIYSIESVSKVKGYYRVGRDDRETTIKSVLFKDVTFNPSKEFISIINGTLEIELSKKNKRYSWEYVESEYVAGLAESSDSTAKYQKENISKLEKMIIRKSLHDNNWINTISSK